MHRLKLRLRNGKYRKKQRDTWNTVNKSPYEWTFRRRVKTE